MLLLGAHWDHWGGDGEVEPPNKFDCFSGRSACADLTWRFHLLLAAAGLRWQARLGSNQPPKF